MIPNKLPLRPTTVYADSTTEKNLAATGWFACGELLKVRAKIEIIDLAGPLEIGLGLETADLVTSPLATTVIFAREDSVGVKFPSAFVDVSSVTQASQIARLVWLTARSGGTGLAFGRVYGEIMFEGRAQFGVYQNTDRSDWAGNWWDIYW